MRLGGAKSWMDENDITGTGPKQEITGNSTRAINIELELFK